MAINKEFLGPRHDGEKETFSIEALVFSVQIALQKAMKKHGVTNKELADRLGMSPARVSQIFSSKGSNLTLKTIAKIQYALGEEFEFVSKYDIHAPKVREEFRQFINVVPFQKLNPVWSEIPSSPSKPKLQARAA